MNEEQRQGASEDFNRAADGAEARRQQQLAALTDTQRRLYEQACARAQEREEARAKELQKRRQADIQERMLRKLLQTPHLELNFHGRRTTITEIHARQLIAEFFQSIRDQDMALPKVLVRQANQAATREVEQEHARERNIVQAQEREILDRLLRRFERGRDVQLGNRQDFARAATAGKARTDFQQAAKDAALSRAFAKVAREEEEERQRGGRSDGKERSR